MSTIFWLYAYSCYFPCEHYNNMDCRTTLHTKCSRLIDWLCSVLRPRQHSIGYTHASPAWWGFASADDRNRLEAFLWKSAKLGYRAKHSTTLASICNNADCKLFTRIILNTWYIRSYLLNASITTLTLFVNADTTFNFLIAHQFSKTVLWCPLFTILFFSSYSLFNSVLSMLFY